MKLYTKRGDKGLTNLCGGQRVSKDSLRVEAYGSVDELNSFIGLTVEACKFEELRTILLTVQNQLFDMGSDLAMPRAKTENPEDHNAEHPADWPFPHIAAHHIRELENHIDKTCQPLPPMKHFILPGGSELAARLHVARTVCRRVERLCVTLSNDEPIGPHVVIYLNRLSDLLFAMARRANQLQGVEDVPWSKKSAD